MTCLCVCLSVHPSSVPPLTHPYHSLSIPLALSSSCPIFSISLSPTSRSLFLSRSLSPPPSLGLSLSLPPLSLSLSPLSLALCLSPPLSLALSLPLSVSLSVSLSPLSLFLCLPLSVSLSRSLSLSLSLSLSPKTKFQHKVYHGENAIYSCSRPSVCHSLSPLHLFQPGRQPVLGDTSPRLTAKFSPRKFIPGPTPPPALGANSKDNAKDILKSMFDASAPDMSTFRVLYNLEVSHQCQLTDVCVSVNSLILIQQRSLFHGQLQLGEIYERRQGLTYLPCTLIPLYSHHLCHTFHLFLLFKTCLKSVFIKHLPSVQLTCRSHRGILYIPDNILDGFSFDPVMF